MKHRKINEFSEKTRALFIFNYDCWESRHSYRGLNLHHILKHGPRRSKLESSPLNAAPICPICHDRGDIHSFEKRSKYLKKTIRYLLKTGYKLTQRDVEFYLKYKKFYD